jgi:hypothetical protein
MLIGNQRFRVRWLILLPIVCWLFINGTVNRHVHLLPDGCMVSHSHPLSKSSDAGPNHEHSKKELLIFSLISNPDATAANTCVLIPAPSGLLITPVKLLQEQQVVREHYEVRNYHAPPA